MSHLIKNVQPTPQTFNLQADSDPYGEQPTVGTDSGSWGSQHDNYNFTAVHVDTVAYTTATIPLFTGGVANEGKIQQAIAEAMESAGYTNVDNLTVTITGSGNSVTVAITHVGEATLNSVTINSTVKTLTRA